MKHSIEWHQDCHKNRKSYLERQKQELLRIKERLEKEISRLEIEVEFEELQINTAIAQKKDGFDPDLFLKNKRPS